MKGFVVLAGLICVCFGGCTAQRDLRLLAFGKDTTATISYFQRERLAKKRYRYAVVEFEFDDQHGKQRRGRDRVGADWKRPADQQVEITYLPHSPSVSEIKGNWHVFHWMILAVGLFLVFGTHKLERSHLDRKEQ
ncbi:MAG: DUF3592 domain-containing protein [Planctomycetota bacterium]